MAYISVEFGGKKTFGGYLSIDGDKQMVLTEGLLIKVDDGPHNLHFMNVPSGNKTVSDINFFAGNYMTSYMMDSSMIEGTISETLGSNDLLVLTVISGNKGKILDVPNYRITSLEDEGIRKLDEMYSSQGQSGLQKDGSNVKVEFFLCLFLGWLGIHKFYRGKTLMGVVYMFTLGLGTIGWIIDTITCLIKLIHLKRS